MYIKDLPISACEKYPKLKRRYQELYRKFGEVKKQLLHESSFISTYGIGTPIRHEAYKKMKPKEWRESMLKYDTDQVTDWKSNKGSVLEHSRQFEAEVKENPNKFVSFIEELIAENKVTHDYLLSGLRGLVEGKYTPDKTFLLYKQTTRLGLDRANTLYGVWLIDYFIQHNVIDKEVIEYLADLAIHHEDPSQVLNEHDPMSDSLNSVRGAALGKLMNCYYLREHKELIFATVETAISDTHQSVRVAILYQLAWLNHLDLERAFVVFQKLINTNEVKILEAALIPAQYFIHKFSDKMQSFLNKIIDLKIKSEITPYIVYNFWYIDSPNSALILEKYLEKVENISAIIFVAEKNLFYANDDLDTKALSILEKFVNSKDEELAHAYSYIFLRELKINHFESLFSFYEKYAASKLCAYNPTYFLKYLTTCSTEYPKQCLTLLKKINFRERPDIQKSGYYDKEPLTTLLAIYSALNRATNKDVTAIENALDLFDEMLQIEHLRGFANKAMENL